MWVWGVGSDLLGPMLTRADTKVIPTAVLSERYIPMSSTPTGLLPRDNGGAISSRRFVWAVLQLLHKSRTVEAKHLWRAQTPTLIRTIPVSIAQRLPMPMPGSTDGWDSLPKGRSCWLQNVFAYAGANQVFQRNEGPGLTIHLRGIQGFRANTFSNTAAVNGEYPIFRIWVYREVLRFSTYRIWVDSGRGTGATFFDTTFIVGPSDQVTASRPSTISLSYQQSLVTPDDHYRRRISTTLREVGELYACVCMTGPRQVRGGATLMNRPVKLVPAQR